MRKLNKRTDQRSRRRVQRVVRPTGGKPSAAYKEAWMAGARSGSDMAFELIMRSLENMGKTMGFKRTSRPNEKDQL